MRDKRLCVNDSFGFDLPVSERLRLIRRAGFDGFFSDWKPDAPIDEYARAAAREGLVYQSIHAPFSKVSTVWDEGEAGDEYVRMLEDCVQCCADHGVPLAVIHPFIGFDRHEPNALGVERFDRLLRFADTRGVLLGFENVEGEEYLARVMGELSHHPSCRFVRDTGHELCYNGAKDMMALYGDRLAGTHLNDNMGVTGSEITWHDDSHMLPFDGIADWPDIARRLHEHRFEGPLTFELISYNRPGRHTHDAYAGWDAAEFLRQAHARAERFAALI